MTHPPKSLKYSVLTFNFNGYDKVRTPLIIDPEAEYILVSDKEFEHPVWKVVVDPKLDGKDPIYQSYYVRFHPFEYVSTDKAIVIDGSVYVKQSLASFIERFDACDRDMAILVANWQSDLKKIEFWKKQRNLSQEDQDNLIKLMEELGCKDMLGSTTATFKICRNNYNVNHFNDTVWEYLLQCGSNGNPNRLDEVVFHIVLAKFFMHLKLQLYSCQITHSNVMQYKFHGTVVDTKDISDYDDLYYLCGLPVSPKRVGDERIYPTVYAYKTEAILITKFMTEADLKEWIDHHLYKCKFEHIQIFANDLPFDIRRLASIYDDRQLSIKLVKGEIRQYDIYNRYIAECSQAEWVMPIDDDEYLELAPEFESVYDAIMYYKRKIPHLNMLGVRWKHLFPKRFHTERKGKVLEYCTEENAALAALFKNYGDHGIKTIVRRYGHIHYEETWENPVGGHVPANSCSAGAKIFNGKIVNSVCIPSVPEDTSDEKIRLIHCRYKGESDWKNKYENKDPSKNCKTISDTKPKEKKFGFTEILPFLD